MLNYRRRQSYGNATPHSCAISMFGVGIILTLAGIVLMVITKKAKRKEEFPFEINKRGDEERSYDRFKPNKRDEEERSYDRLTPNKRRREATNSILKTLGPILLGVGITVIVLVFFIVALVACNKEVQAPATNTQLPQTSSQTQQIASAPPFSLLPEDSPAAKTSCHQVDLLLGNPPPYDEICIEQRTGENSKCSNDRLIPLRPI